MTRGSYKTAANDFRSDTFTTPTPTILQAALDSTVGDDVYKEDDDTNALEHKVATLAGKEAGLFCVSGTLSNQIAIRTHLHQPPYSILCDYRAHIYAHEAAGLSTLSNAMVIPVKPSNGHYLTLEDIEEYIIADDGNIHGAPTKLISLENTLHGVIFPYHEIKKISDFARSKGISIHCDGARLWNASIQTGISLKEYGVLFDTISLCLSKSLGAPVGSVLVGPQKFIQKANHFRKQNGGGIRQSGPLAAMASVAIDENLSKIKASHEKAKSLADFLLSKGFVLEVPADTNFVFIDTKKTAIDNELLFKYANEFNIKVWPSRVSFHYQITEESLEKVKQVLLLAFEETKAKGISPKKQVVYGSAKEE